MFIALEYRQVVVGDAQKEKKRASYAPVSERCYMLDKKLFENVINRDQEEWFDEESGLYEVEQVADNMYVKPSQWVIAERYRVPPSGKIEVEKLGNYRIYNPAEDADLFRSFTKVGGNARQFERRIEDWVGKHGLLELEHHELRENCNLEFEDPYSLFVTDKSRPGERKTLNQRPVDIGEFKMRVRQARSAVELYKCLHDGDYPALANWIGHLEQVRTERELNDVELICFRSKGEGASEQLERRLPPENSPQNSEPVAAGQVMLIVSAFEVFLQKKLSGVRLSLSPESGLLFPKDKYAPRRVYHCPDLLSAIWLQFYIAITERHPIKRCKNPNCSRPFFPAQGNQKYCCPSCTSTGRPSRRETAT